MIKINYFDSIDKYDKNIGCGGCGVWAFGATIGIFDTIFFPDFGFIYTMEYTIISMVLLGLLLLSLYFFSKRHRALAAVVFILVIYFTTIFYQNVKHPSIAERGMGKELKIVISKPMCFNDERAIEEYEAVRDTDKYPGWISKNTMFGYNPEMRQSDKVRIIGEYTGFRGGKYIEVVPLYNKVVTKKVFLRTEDLEGGENDDSIPKDRRSKSNIEQ